MNKTVIEKTGTYDEKIVYYDELLARMSSQLKVCLCMDYEKADSKTVDQIKQRIDKEVPSIGKFMALKRKVEDELLLQTKN